MTYRLFVERLLSLLMIINHKQNPTETFIENAFIIYMALFTKGHMKLFSVILPPYCFQERYIKQMALLDS